MIGKIKDPMERWFAYAVEREQIRKRREDDKQAPPFTDDLILQKHRFCNVYREDDRTTRWCKQYVRDPLIDKPEVLLAVVMFRWFNRITTGEAIFCQEALTYNGLETAFEHYLRAGKTNILLHAIKNFCGNGPYVTGAYTILGFRGMPKLQGVLKAIETFDSHAPISDNWRNVAKNLLKEPGSLNKVWTWLKDFPYLGGFTAAQIVADLKYTNLLSDAEDWYTFAKSGPGSRRGLNLVYGRPMKQSWREDEWHYYVLKLREKTRLWFLNAKMQPPHAQDIQNICCEFSKYEKTRLGEGRPRGVFAK